MKYSICLGAAALLATGVSASPSHQHKLRHVHPKLARNVNNATETDCPVVCSTYVTSYLVDVTPTAEPTIKVTATVTPIEATSTSTSTQVTTVTVPKAAVPTPEVTVCPTPGTYTIPAKTVTLTSTTAVCVPSETSVPSGTHTLGGVTTIVTTATTVVCPVATVETTGGVTTSRVFTTTYVCPTAGTYTINPITTVVPTSTVVRVPQVTVYEPGTYTHPEIVTTVTETNYVVTCPLETVKVTATVVPVAETPVAVPAATSAATPVEVPAASSPAAPVASSPAASPSSAPAPGPIQHSGAWAITYSPFNNDRSCRAPADIKRDIADIASKKFKAIRVYAPDCGEEYIRAIMEACETSSLKIILGLFIEDSSFSSANKQLDLLMKLNKWSIVELFVVGNEAVFNRKCTGSQLAGYISQVTQKVRGAGYNGPITTAEPLNILQEIHSEICPVIDALGPNIHPFFNPQVTPEKAGEFVVDQLKRAVALCGGNKPGYVLEAGWPSRGEANGAAVPGATEQAAAIESIRKASPGNVVYFTYSNDGWKDPGAFSVEPNFGCASLF